MIARHAEPRVAGFEGLGNLWVCVPLKPWKASPESSIPYALLEGPFDLVSRVSKVGYGG